MRTVNFVLACAFVASAQWEHFSTAEGDLPAPNQGKQQTSAVIADFDRDGVNDFIITERTAAPSVVLYRRTKSTWIRNVVDDTALRIEAGSVAFDVDADGDADFVAGGDASSNQIWWWENPGKGFDLPWTRRLVKDSGGRKHHDLLFADIEGDAAAELVFWNQGARTLNVAEIPKDPRTSGPWAFRSIYSYSEDSEPEQRFVPPRFKRVNEHEGLTAIDIDGDGRLDLVGGGRWFKNDGGRWIENIVDAGYAFSRSAAGQFIEGGRPEIVLTVGDGEGPLVLYEWSKGTWKPKVLIPYLDNGHNIAAVDVDKDGHLDIFTAEMRLGGRKPDSKIYFLLGDGKGSFRTSVVAEGFGLHESQVADLNGDGLLDILGKPYDWETPRLDVWLKLR